MSLGVLLIENTAGLLEVLPSLDWFVDLSIRGCLKLIGKKMEVMLGSAIP